MLIIEGRFKWISTLGGPLILMERSAISVWNGDLGHTIPPDPNFISDYDRASSIEDYVGIITVGDYEAIVFSMPSHTSYIPIDSKTFLLVRWIWANDEEQVASVLREFSLEQNWIETNIEMYFNSGDLVLFDSVYEGMAVEDSLNIKVEPGNYHVSTLSYQPNSEVSLFLIRFEKFNLF